MLAFMVGFVLFSRKCFCAIGTFERRFACVQAIMRDEVVLSGKCLRTICAGVRSFARMAAHMIDEMFVPGEGLKGKNVDYSENHQKYRSFCLLSCSMCICEVIRRCVG
jgi:hypothetical protein